MLEILNNVIYTLNQIEVHGEKNMAMLYNSIEALRGLHDGLVKNKVDQEVRANAVVASKTE